MWKTLDLLGWERYIVGVFLFLFYFISTIIFIVLYSGITISIARVFVSYTEI